MQVRSLQGDTLDALCWRHLAQTAGVVEAALELNRGLAALGPTLPLGTLVELPTAATVQTQATVNLWD